MMDKRIKVLEMIAQDQKDDAANFEGRPFTGRTVAEYFGNQGAAIAALAEIIKSDLQTRDAEQRVHPLSGGEQDDVQEVERTTEIETGKAGTADVAPHSAGG